MKKLLSLFAIAIAMMACAQPAKVAGDQERLWYDAPAGRWLEALPLGNGQMAAMVFGGIADETIQLNESTFWSGSPHDNNSKTSLQHLDEVRQLIYAGREEEAEALINKEFIPGPHGQRFLTLGSLRMHFENMPEEVRLAARPRPRHPAGRQQEGRIDLLPHAELQIPLRGCY